MAGSLQLGDAKRRPSPFGTNLPKVFTVEIKQYKPTSPGRRFQTVSDFAEITTSKPEKSLLAPKPKKAGRNCYGRITVRHQGGGNKQRYRIIATPSNHASGCIHRHTDAKMHYRRGV